MPKSPRVLLFFLYFFGLGIGLPALVGLVVEHFHGALNVPPATASNWGVSDGRFVNAARLLAADGMPTVSLGVQFRSARAVSLLTAQDGSMRMAVLADSPAQLQQAAQLLARRFGVELATDAREQRVQVENSYHARMRRSDHRLLLVVGMDAAAVERRMAALPGLGDGPDGDWRVAPPRVRHALLAGLFLWVGLQFLIFGRLASWAGGEPATPGVVPVTATELGNRLLALNQLDAPWAVTRGRHPDEYVVDWRYADAKWLARARLSGMSRGYRLVLRLDPGRHNARAQGRHASLDWSAGIDGGQLGWQASRGIDFYEYRYERMYGLQFHDGKPSMDLQYEYSFDMRELKDPVMQVVRDAGWNYRPVISFFRPIGG
ncbi:MAG: hypothetical protein L0H23_07835 [Luteimonas sp.]|nr:hypothetical protein [Luteimonas sp.]